MEDREINNRYDSVKRTLHLTFLSVCVWQLCRSRSTCTSCRALRAAAASSAWRRSASSRRSESACVSTITSSCSSSPRRPHTPSRYNTCPGSHRKQEEGQFTRVSSRGRQTHEILKAFPTQFKSSPPPPPPPPSCQTSRQTLASSLSGSLTPSIVLHLLTLRSVTPLDLPPHLLTPPVLPSPPPLFLLLPSPFSLPTPPHHLPGTSSPQLSSSLHLTVPPPL